MPDLIDVIDQRIEHKRDPDQIEGTIFSVEAGIARIRWNNQIKKAYYNVGDPGVQAGMACLAVWSKRRNAYIIQSVYSNAPGANALGTRPTSSFELAPPSNLNTKAIVAGYLTAEWASPPQSPVAFEVQYSPTGSDLDALVALVTRGSYAFIAVTGASGNVRVRSIDDQFRRSSWTAWVSGVPGTGGGLPAGSEERVVLYDETLASDDIFSITGLSQDYVELEMSLSRARTDNAGDWDPVRLEFNGDDNDGNYHYLLPTFDGGFNSDTGDAPYIGYVVGDTAAGNHRSTILLRILDYTSAYYKHTSILNNGERRDPSGAHIVRHGDLHWEGLDPIEDLVVKPQFGSAFLSGTRLRVIGIR